MVDWIPNLPVALIALVALVGMALLTLAIYALVIGAGSFVLAALLMLRVKEREAR